MLWLETQIGMGFHLSPPQYNSRAPGSDIGHPPKYSQPQDVSALKLRWGYGGSCTDIVVIKPRLHDLTTRPSGVFEKQLA